MELKSGADKKLFAKAPSHITRLLFLILLSIVIMTMDYRYKSLESVRTWLNTALYPVYFAADIPLKFGSWLGTFFTEKTELISTNDLLKNENMQLKKQLQKSRYIENENHRLRGLLKMSSRLLKDDAQIAEVLNVKPNLDQNELLINKGLSDGVFKGQPVLNTKGVIGQVIHVALKTSTVLLITSPRHALPVQINENLYRATAQGNGSLANLKLKRVSPFIEIKPGFLVETSGLGGVFPPGYPVGIVDKVIPQSLFTKVEVKPFADNLQIREILLIWPPKHSNSTNDGS